MMRITKFLFLFLLLSIAACNKDDDGGTKIEIRDEAEVAQEDEAAIKTYLETHYFELVDNPLNSNYQLIKFGKITEDTPDKTPIMESEYLKSKTVKPRTVEYTLYYLQIRKGAEGQYQPTFADAAVLTYRGEHFDGSLFDQQVNPSNFDLPGGGSGGFITGFVEGVDEFRGASSFEENTDGTISYSDDFGMGAVFVPSGLAYFAFPTSSAIDEYEPLIFSFQVYAAQQLDHDGDGIPSYMEDVNGNRILSDDNTDNDASSTTGNPIYNYIDSDDDGDGTPTADEIEVNDANGDGIITEDEIIFTDSNNDGTPDYLDPDIF